MQASERSASTLPHRGSARERILAAADELFLTEGIHNTGIISLIHRADVAKASFYSAFKSKNDLIDAYLERQHDDIVSRLHIIADADDSPEEKLSHIFDLLCTFWVQASYRGCLFVVAQIELPDSELPARRWARIHKLDVLSILGPMLEHAGYADSDELAEQLCVIFDGILVAASIRPESEAFDRGRSMALALLNAASRASKERS
ncbi:TetR/AcrR family transcriptional regulator [Rhodococcus opacus]|uniref:TetR/AcrR family transcriptional regulator n=1 Tax=Rhodococcus opacus TaxID=37919 RepID=UPI002236BB43|nr:TetR/AcrR family transcriptional regulator [Rhodococcus opacus]UZG60305.1 TetR/AcrR family transcriptional regulator [Rhodococcus opacus]